MAKFVQFEGVDGYKILLDPNAVVSVIFAESQQFVDVVIYTNHVAYKVTDTPTKVMRKLNITVTEE